MHTDDSPEDIPVSWKAQIQRNRWTRSAFIFAVMVGVAMLTPAQDLDHAPHWTYGGENRPSTLG
jgi:hypothetical protein